MGRIDDALRRAALERATTMTPGAYGAGAEAALLDDYAPEDSSAVPSTGLPEPSPEPREVSAPAPSVTRMDRLAQAHRVLEGRLVSDTRTDRASIEQFRRLATTLHHLQLERGSKTVMVTSAVPREGKTLTSMNLALVLGESYGRRVLLIDGDLRRPFVHELFKIPNTTGLADALASDGASLPVIEIAPRLTVLPAGRPSADPATGLASNRMAALLKEASRSFDWIILDTPPVLMTSDATLIASFVDGVILVIGAGETDHHLIAQTVAEIGRERVIGAVLNRVEPRSLLAGCYDKYHGHRPKNAPA